MRDDSQSKHRVDTLKSAGAGTAIDSQSAVWRAIALSIDWARDEVEGCSEAKGQGQPSGSGSVERRGVLREWLQYARSFNDDAILVSSSSPAILAARGEAMPSTLVASPEPSRVASLRSTTSTRTGSYDLGAVAALLALLLLGAALVALSVLFSVLYVLGAIFAVLSGLSVVRRTTYAVRTARDASSVQSDVA